MIESISLRNVLSFGSSGTTLELKPLTVLIGPNGCGKSNVLEILYLLSRLPVTDSEASLPIVDWIWKGSAPDAIAQVEIILKGVDAHKTPFLRHRLEFRSIGQRFSVHDELIEARDKTDPNAPRSLFFFRYDQGKALFSNLDFQDGRPKRTLRREDLDQERSVISQRNDPEEYPEIAHVRSAYEGIRVYRDINFGPRSPTRQPQRTDLPLRALVEDGSNLALIINRLRNNAGARKRLEALLKRFYEPADGVDVEIVGGTAQVGIFEHTWKVPATRLSDGTMRWLTLLAVLLDPEPAKVVCLDEPDLGLHPDIIPVLGDLIQEASERMQVIVTTHSDELVDALSERPDSVVVCEKLQGATNLKRLQTSELGKWLDEYSLGELWNSGQIGGRRV